MLLVVNWKKVFLSFNHEEVKASSGAVKMLPELNEMASMAIAVRWGGRAAMALRWQYDVWQRTIGKKKKKYHLTHSRYVSNLLQGLGNSLLTVGIALSCWLFVC